MLCFGYEVVPYTTSLRCNGLSSFLGHQHYTHRINSPVSVTPPLQKSQGRAQAKAQQRPLTGHGSEAPMPARQCKAEGKWSMLVSSRNTQNTPLGGCYSNKTRYLISFPLYFFLFFFNLVVGPHSAALRLLLASLGGAIWDARDSTRLGPGLAVFEASNLPQFYCSGPHSLLKALQIQRADLLWWVWGEESMKCGDWTPSILHGPRNPPE